MTNQTNENLKVERRRLNPGGDIFAATSADIIVTTYSSAPKIRPPFREGERLFVTTSILSGVGATAYALVPCEEGAADERKPGDQFAGRVVQHDGAFYRMQGPAVEITHIEEETAKAPESTESLQPEAESSGVELLTSEEFTSGIHASSTSQPTPEPRTDPQQSTSHEAPAPDPEHTTNEEARCEAQDAASPETATLESSEHTSEDEDEAEAETEAETESAPTPDADARAQAKAPEKKVYQELLPDRSYALADVGLKLIVNVFPSGGQMLGRDVRITTQVYDHAPVITRHREHESGGLSAIIIDALSDAANSLPRLEAAYKTEQEEAARQVAVKREKELADKIRQQQKKKTATSSSAAKPATTSSPSAPAKPTTTVQEQQPAPAAHQAPPNEEAEAQAQREEEEFAGVAVVDDDRPSEQTAPVAPPPSTLNTPAVKRVASRKPAAPSNQGSFF